VLPEEVVKSCDDKINAEHEQMLKPYKDETQALQAQLDKVLQGHSDLLDALEMLNKDVDTVHQWVDQYESRDGPGKIKEARESAKMWNKKDKAATLKVITNHKAYRAANRPQQQQQVWYYSWNNNLS